MEAMGGGGRLTLEPRLDGDRVEITISDNGPGIPKADQAKLFTPFFTTKSKGTGLGLCVSKRIIEDHPGSSLKLDSEEGKGTIAKIVLPVFPKREGHPAREPVQREPAGRSGYSIQEKNRRTR
jgi:signal transduction histidine kinase